MTLSDKNRTLIPGEYILANDDIQANASRETTKVKVVNTGDRPVQIGSHFHFFEVNKMMSFNRDKAFGMRLNIPAGTAVRFEPGEEKEVDLVTFGGKKVITGFSRLTEGKTKDAEVRKEALKRASKNNFKTT